MNVKLFTRLAMAAAAGAGLAASSITGVYADTSPTASPSSASRLQYLQQKGGAAINARLTEIGKLTDAVNKSTDITASDKSTLLSELAADQSGLQALESKIQSDTTASQAYADDQTIVTGYRIYVLEAPKVYLVIAADTENSVEPKIAAVLPELQTLINNSNADPGHKQQAQSALNDCTAQLSVAESASSGVSGSVINLQASGYPGNESTIISARDNVKNARAALQKCRSDINDVRTDLNIH